MQLQKFIVEWGRGHEGFNTSTVEAFSKEHSINILHSLKILNKERDENIESFTIDEWFYNNRRDDYGDSIIIQAAHRAKDSIFPCHRHFDESIRYIIKTSTPEIKNMLLESEQGFIDQYGRFYTKKEARVIAEKNNQIIKDHEIGGEELFSEHLY